MAWISRSGALTQAEMENNADIVIAYFRSQGINDNTIAGILGNMQAESSINPEREEVGGQGYRISTMDASNSIAKSLCYTWIKSI